jgi:uncharacterized protein (DUF488 family)
VSTLYTIGHSTRTLDQLVAALKAHGVGTLVDIRAFPMSRRMPHFNRESLERELPAHGIRYVWMKELGGHRKKIRDDSPNTGLRNDSFRNYADYMLTPEFQEAIQKLLRIAEEGRAAGTATRNESEEDGGPSSRTPAEALASPTAPNTAYMCAERVYFQCHRMLVSDYLTAHGHTVLHIDDEKRTPRAHRLMSEAHLVNDKLVYNAQQLF